MNILVLNGSPRPQGNTVKMVAAFRESAEKAGHIVNIVNVCRKNIKGCLACEYCHGKGQGQCVQKDDMQEVYGYLRDTDMLILASPIYYHGISGQLKCTIDRFYSALYPTAPVSLTKTAMFLSSGDPEMYEGAKFSFEGDFLGYLGLENMGMFTCAGDVKESVLEDAVMLLADYQQQGYGCKMTTLLIERLTEMTGRKNYYVLITREDIPELPYSIKEIYGIRTSGKYHFPEQIYHEFYQIYEDNSAGNLQ